MVEVLESAASKPALPITSHGVDALRDDTEISPGTIKIIKLCNDI